MRVGGSMVAVDHAPVGADELLAQISRMVPAHLKGDVMGEATRGLDFSYTEPAAGRFRCSAFRTLSRLGITMRTIKSTIPSLESLHLPTAVMDVALSQRGMTLVTGTTGSGKSTTLAAMIDLINANYDVKVITVEDPIEYLHEDKRAMITQIEVGSDSVSFDQALRQALRQDPDVILIGELRDVETLRMAPARADTGHQVFATVHAARAAQTIERIIAMFPPAEHKVLLSQLAHSLEAVISQRLVVTREGDGGAQGPPPGGGDPARRAGDREVHHRRQDQPAQRIHRGRAERHADVRPAPAADVPAEADQRHGGAEARQPPRRAGDGHARHPVRWPGEGVSARERAGDSR